MISLRQLFLNSGESEAIRLMPNFLVLGTQKGGTTTLQKLFEHDSRFFLPSCKEVHYFTLNSKKSLKWYTDHFKDSKPEQMRGEITPYYLFHPETSMKVKKLIPKVRLIALLRDPVERVFSQYFHAVRHGFESLDLESALLAEKERLASGSQYSHQKHSYISRSRYLEQLDRFEKLFPKKQILIIKSEDLFSKTNTTWREIQQFLKINPKDLHKSIPHENGGKGESLHVPQKIREKLRAELSKTSEGVRTRYGIDWGW